MKATEIKAKELVEMFRQHAKIWDNHKGCFDKNKNDIKCAIICANSNIETLKKLHKRSVLSEYIELEEMQEYIEWQEVLTILKEM